MLSGSESASFHRTIRRIIGVKQMDAVPKCKHCGRRMFHSRLHGFACINRCPPETTLPPHLQRKVVHAFIDSSQRSNDICIVIRDGEPDLRRTP